MIINTLYDIGDTVYLTTDKEQLPRLITDIKISPGNVQMYEVMNGTTASRHYEMELSKEKNDILTMKD